MPHHRTRFTLWMKLALLAALGVVAMHAVHLALGNRIAARTLMEAQARLGTRVARMIAEQADAPMLVSDVMTLHGLVHSAAADAEDASYCFILRDGHVVASSFDGATPAGLIALRGAGDTEPVLVALDGAQVLDVTAPILGGILGQVRLGLGMKSLRQLRHELGVHLGELALAVIGLGLVAAFVTGRTIAKPIREMLAAADRFDPSGDDDGPIVATRGSDEVAVLGRRFNSMMRRLEAAHAEQRRAQQKAVETERLAALGSLVAGVAHEVNNPLAGLKNCLRRLERGDLPAAKQHEYLSLMDEGLTRIEEIVRRLLDYGRPHATRLVPVPAHLLARDAVRLVAPHLESRGVRTPVLADGVEATVLADRRQVGQAVINLLLNAAYVTPDGGEVRLGVIHGEGRIGISVEDDGPGIPAEIRDRILDPFFSTKPEGQGTGLGLSVTRTIADAHGGELAFEFPARGGTTATLWLRAAGTARGSL